MKGQYKMMADILVGLLVVALCVAIYFAFLGYYVIIKTIVTSAEEDRNAINLAQVLISSDKLACSDDKHIQRGILDEKKLSSLDSAILFEEVSYPSYKYFLNITNLDTGKNWIIGERFDAKILKTFPVAIKNGDDIQIGRLSLGLEREKS